MAWWIRKDFMRIQGQLTSLGPRGARCRKVTDFTIRKGCLLPRKQLSAEGIMCTGRKQSNARRHVYGKGVFTRDVLRIYFSDRDQIQNLRS